jgi:hypothetical protein
MVLARWLSHKIEPRNWVGDNLGKLEGPAFEIRGPTSLLVAAQGTFKRGATQRHTVRE